MARSVWATLALCLAITSGCDRGSDGGGAAVVAASSGVQAGAALAPELVCVRFTDTNQSATVDAGDALVLTLRERVDPSTLDIANLTLTTGDDLGLGAAFVAGPAATTIELRLGNTPHLALFDTYTPNDQRNQTPAACGFPGGVRIPITAVSDPTIGFHGATYAHDAAYRPFYGLLHAHTGFSDGQATPAVAADFARDQGHLDFFATTDHLEQLMVPGTEYGDTHYMLDARNAANQFVTLIGYEWGGGPESLIPLVWSNHINVIGDPTLMPLRMDRRSFYEALKRRGTAVVGKFNHPGLDRKGPLIIDQWDHFRYDRGADTIMRLIRADIGDDNDTIGYQRCLDAGWHVSPVSSEDNHQADWGTRSQNRTGVYARELTRDAVMEALREMRTFSTGDPDAEILAVSGSAIMGSTLTGDGAHELRISVHDRSGDGFEAIELITLAGTMAARYDAGGQPDATWTVSVDPAGDRWYYARARQQDGDLLYAAPFFIDR